MGTSRFNVILPGAEVPHPTSGGVICYRTRALQDCVASLVYTSVVGGRCALLSQAMRHQPGAMSN